MGEETRGRIGVGASSVLLILMVLCLTTLGILSFASARMDLSLTEKRTEQVEAYHTQKARAAMLLAEVEEGLAEAGMGSDALEAVVRSVAPLGVDVWADADGTVSFRFPVSEAQALEARIYSQNARVILQSYALVNLGEWNAEEPLSLVWPEPSSEKR